jgi:hypothetical protein
MARKIGLAAAPAIALLLVGIAGGSSPVTVAGKLTVTTDSGDYSFCDNDSYNVGQGTQVTVVSPSGTAIGTGSLSAPATTTSDMLGCAYEVDVYKFSVTSLPSEPRYGVQVNGEQGTIWFTPSEISDASLSLGEGN